MFGSESKMLFSEELTKEIDVLFAELHGRNTVQE